MSMSSIPSHSPSGKLYGWVERIGNKVPHPFLLFIYLIVILMVATAVLSAFDVSVRSRLTAAGGGKTCSASTGCTGFTQRD